VGAPVSAELFAPIFSRLHPACSTGALYGIVNDELDRASPSRRHRRRSPRSLARRFPFGFRGAGQLPSAWQLPPPPTGWPQPRIQSLVIRFAPRDPCPTGTLTPLYSEVNPGNVAKNPRDGR